MYVFEFKSARVLNSIFKLDNEKDIEESINKVIKKPIIQAINRMNEIILQKVKKEDLNEFKNYYFIAVSMNNFPIHYSNFKEISMLIQNSNIKIQGCFNFSTEEYELLCDASAKQEKSIGFFLDDFRNNYPDNYSFKNYIRQFNKGINSVVFREIEQELKNFTNNVKL